MENNWYKREEVFLGPSSAYRVDSIDRVQCTGV